MTIYRLLPFFVTVLFAAAVHAQSSDGPLVVSSNGHWFEYRDSGKPFFMAGVGGPEGFFYETDERKQQIVDQLISSGANALYMHTIRSFEGDGFSFEDPFNTHEDINSGVNAATLTNWRGYLDQLDSNRIVSWIHIIDDTARPWGCTVPLSQAAKDYIETIVKAFRDLDHLVWLSGEEYLMGSCNASQDKALMSAIAAEIRKHDSVHPIGVHHNNGQAMQFGDDPNVNVFAQQICGSSSVRNPQGIHNQAAWNDWVYVMAECHPWHKDLIESGGRTDLRLSNWASAMGGGYVLMYDAYECPNKLCTRNSDESVKPVVAGHDPTAAMLADLTRLHQFMTQSRFAELSPSDNLAEGGTQWVMGNTSKDVYIAYAGNSPSTLGVTSLFDQAVYKLRWFDPANGTSQQMLRLGSQSPFDVPDGFSNEVALAIELDDSSPVNRPPIANPDNYLLMPNTLLTVTAGEGVLKNDSDFEEDSLSASIVTATSSGTVNLNTNGSFTYQPNTDFNGDDSFTYKVNDGQQDSNTTTVTLQVSDQPIVTLWLVNADNDTRDRRLNNGDTIILSDLTYSQFAIEAEIDNAGSVRFVYSGLVSGNRTENQAPYAMFGDTASDFNGENLVVGSLSINAAAYSGDNAGGDVVADRDITISFANSQPNRAPIARPDIFYVLKDTLLDVSSSNGVLRNDSDPDGDSLTASLISDVQTGTLNLQSNGSFTYTSPAGVTGADSFQYQVNDGELDSSPVIVTINVVETLPEQDLCFPVRMTPNRSVLICL